MDRQRTGEGAETQATGASPSSRGAAAIVLGTSPPANLVGMPSFLLCMSPERTAWNAEAIVGESERAPAPLSAELAAEFEAGRRVDSDSKDGHGEDSLSVSSSSTSFATSINSGRADSREEPSANQLQLANLSGTRIACQRCDRNFSSMSHLRRHTRDVHQNVRKYACVHCGTAFKRRQHLESHSATCNRRNQPSRATEWEQTLATLRLPPSWPGAIHEETQSMAVASALGGSGPAGFERSLPPLLPVDEVSQRMSRASTRVESAGGRSKNQRARSCEISCCQRKPMHDPQTLPLEYWPPIDWLSDPRSSQQPSSTGSTSANPSFAAETSSETHLSGFEKQRESPATLFGDRMSFFTNNSTGNASLSDLPRTLTDYGNVPTRNRSQSDPARFLVFNQNLASPLSHKTEHLDASASASQSARMTDGESSDPEMLRILDTYTWNVCFSKLFGNGDALWLETDTPQNSVMSGMMDGPSANNGPMTDELDALFAQHDRNVQRPAHSLHSLLSTSGASSNTQRMPDRSLRNRAVSQMRAMMAPAPLPTNLYTHIPSEPAMNMSPKEDRPYSSYQSKAPLSPRRDRQVASASLRASSTEQVGSSEIEADSGSNAQRMTNSGQDKGNHYWGTL